MTDETKQAEAQAAELLAAERRERVEACKRDLEEACRKHRCRISPAVIVRQGSNTPILEVLPVE